jgi:hypothetical protein
MAISHACGMETGGKELANKFILKVNTNLSAVQCGPSWPFITGVPGGSMDLNSTFTLWASNPLVRPAAGWLPAGPIVVGYDGH